MRKVKVPQCSQLCAGLPHLEAGTHVGPYVLIEPKSIRGERFVTCVALGTAMGHCLGEEKNQRGRTTQALDSDY